MKVLFVDEPWSHTPWLLQACRDQGLEVEVAVRRSGIARCRTLGITAHLLPDDPAGEQGALMALLADPGWDRVVPVSERLLLICSRSASAAVASMLPVAREKLPLLADRRRMNEFVAALGISIPPHVPLPDIASVEQAALRLHWPLVLRGCQGTGASQVVIAHDIASACEAWHRLRDSSIGEPFAQAFVPGTIVIVGGLFRAGRVVRAVCSEPVERWPGPTSPSIVQRTFRDPRIEQITLSLMRALDYNGLACLELMRCADGNYVFIELNPRSWASLACSRPLGIDFPRMYAQAIAGTATVDTPLPVDDVPVGDIAVDGAFAVPAGVDLPVFPRYLAAQIAMAGMTGLLQNPRLLWRGICAAPWLQPRLLLALTRQIVGAVSRNRRQPGA